MLTDRDRIKQKLAAIVKSVADIQTLIAQEEAKTDKANKVRPESLAAAVKKLSAQGLTQREIANKFGSGVDAMTVNAILKGFRPSDEFKAKAKPKRKA